MFKSTPKLHTLRISPPELYIKTEDEYNEMQYWHHEFVGRLLRCLRIPPKSGHSGLLLPMLDTLEILQVDNSVWRQRWKSVRSALRARWRDNPSASGLRRVLITVVDTSKARRFQSRMQRYATKTGKLIQVQLYRGTSDYEVDESETSDNEEFEFDNSLQTEQLKWALRDRKRSC
ncbi:hypothetical protein Hypma_007285 [Hypsizygus marmoreus]|uniref:Uncharacterized protein n=1 Tax=Hypsizygus marmoreus TaxID=39966 RepID=A0A369K8N9_HYPMA|nr:hypothetical protein Hypma_007285 [Hypsizygus marmoreus]